MISFCNLYNYSSSVVTANSNYYGDIISYDGMKFTFCSTGSIYYDDCEDYQYLHNDAADVTALKVCCICSVIANH